MSYNLLLVVEDGIVAYEAEYEMTTLSADEERHQRELHISWVF